MKYQLLLGGMAVVFANSVFGLEEGEFSLDINGFSKHSKDSYLENGVERNYNETNPGIGISYAIRDDLDLRLGGFKNSYHKDSVYAGVHWHKDYYFDDWTVAPGVNLFLVSGYESRTDIPVVLLPSLTFGHRALKLSIGFLPFGDDASVATFQLQFNFKYF